MTKISPKQELTAHRPNNWPRGGGRPKGARNRHTVQLRDMILAALDDVGGQKYLATQAMENPAAFMALIGKVLPTTLLGSIAIDVSIELAQMQAEADRARSSD